MLEPLKKQDFPESTVVAEVAEKDDQPPAKKDLPKEVAVEPVPVLAAAKSALTGEAGDSTEFRRQQLAAHAEEKKKKEEEKQKAKEGKKKKEPKEPKAKGRPRKVEEESKDKGEDGKEGKDNGKKRKQKKEPEDPPAPAKALKRLKKCLEEKPAEKPLTKKEKELATKAAKAEKRKPKAYEFEMDKDLMNEVLGVIQKYEGQTYDKKAETVHKKTLAIYEI